MATRVQYDFNVNLDDLNFILQQIKIAEASTNPETGEIENLPELVGSPLLPYGVRTVDGTWNNLLPGMENVGAADNIMPKLAAGTLQMAENRPVGFYGPQDPGGSTPSNYAVITPGNVVFDTQPRIISNLIVDQTADNPAAVLAAIARAADSTFPGMEQVEVSENGTLLIPNHSPDIGLSPPFNGVMTLFGQFFDHGLDLITKGGGTVFVPLKPDDPLYVEGGHSNFMVLSRASNVATPGPDNILNTPDDGLNGHVNNVTPYIDQNQTYTSHPSHQVFLREYKMVDDKPLATGHLLDGVDGISNWADVKAQARQMLGINLTDADVFNVPLLATDRYGEFLRGPNGFVQIVTVDNGLVEGNPTANNGMGITIPADTVRTGHQFLIDVAHSATPGLVDHDHNPATPKIQATPDSDSKAGGIANPEYDPALPASQNNALFLPQEPGTYDNELLDRHLVTGDGRGNENIGLTAMHAIFHSEHNRLVETYKHTILASGDLEVINEWLLTNLDNVADIPTSDTAIGALNWDGERLFQAGRFATEMQYQHLVFEEFARAVQPAIDPFIFSNSADIDPSIVEEFANVVYRFGHSMLTETVSRLDENLVEDDIGLIEAFLNPLEFDNPAVDEATVIADIVRGMSRQVGNEIDEFVTEALRNNLVGLPLDLATLNLARARETGAPTFNEARAAFYQMTGDAQLKPYTSWADLAPHLKNPASIINFIAAYGTHQSILSETTLDGKRSAATMLVMGGPAHDLDGDGTISSDEDPSADRVAFLTGTGGWNAANSGLNKVDFWIGGLAEAKLEFGGMLGPTFNFVFETQMEKLQNGDRFYYLSRTQGLNMLNQLEENLFSAMVMRNSDLGAEGNHTHLPGQLFMTPSYTLEMNQAHQRTGIAGPNAAILNGDPFREDEVLNAIASLVERRAPHLDNDGDGIFDDGGLLSYAYDGGDHVVLGGTSGDDTLLGGRGMDTVWGDAGNDRIDAGDEADQVHGGDGDDIITDHGTPTGAADFLRGDNGNDVISNGAGNDIVFGGSGQDFFILGPDFAEVFAGTDNDFILGGVGPDVLMGNEGNDWIEGGEGFDGLSGDNSQLFFNSSIIGHDVLNGQGNDTDYDGETGDDIMVQGPGIQRSNGMLGFDWAIHKGDPNGANSDLGIPVFPAQDVFILRDRFDSVEGLSGWHHNDTLIGTNNPTGGVGEPGGLLPGADADSRLLQKNVSLIDGLQALLGKAAVTNPEEAVFDSVNGADILIGGRGSDRFTGKAGDDLIDGDAWLNVRVSVRSKTDPNAEDRTVDSINEIKNEMLAGTINPGQLRIIREIITEPAGNDIDVAIFSDVLASYDLSLNANGTRMVAHLRGTATDGTDTLRNIEHFQFADQLVETINRAATGSPTISDTSPTMGQPLTAVRGSIADPNGIGATTFTYQWQSGSGTTFANIAGATFATFTPAQAQVGQQLRVVATFTDVMGYSEQVTSQPTSIVGALIIGTAAADNLTGTAADDELRGLAGDDRLDGGAGADILIGSTGNDTYVVDNAADFIVEANGAGTDSVETALSAYTMGLNVENMTYTGTGDFAGTGSASANVITGGSGNDILAGEGGVDRLVGGAGNDTLNGGAGIDVMVGGTGDDVYVVDLAGETITELAGEGSDTVRTTLTNMTLGANLENLVFAGTVAFIGTGNGLDNRIDGGNGNDTLNGGAGADTLTGGLGNDTYVVDATGDAIVENASAGTDLVQTTLAVFQLGADLENLTFTGTGAFTGTGNDVVNAIVSGAGNDVLDGGGGADTMTGGQGNDTYHVDTTTDRAIEGLNSGVDTVIATAATYSLASLANVENLTYVGAGAFVGTGNTIDNTITGGALNDTLKGEAGNDVLIGNEGADNLAGDAGVDRLTGGAGNDAMNGGAGNDFFIFNASGFGSDTITGFDANATGGQDLLDLSGLGITATSFASSVAVTDLGANLLVTVSIAGSVTGSITLTGVANTTDVTSADFLLSA